MKKPETTYMHIRMKAPTIVSSFQIQEFSRLQECGFGIEFARKRSYFYTLIDVSEKICENTSVHNTDFTPIAGSAMVINDRN